MNYRERMKEYLKEPDEYSSQWGKWGILNKEQRDLIKRLLREMDSADEVIKNQFFEIERLNNRLKTSNDTCNYLRNTIDKAIEYIDRRDIEWGSEEHEKLLSILKGENNE